MYKTLCQWWCVQYRQFYASLLVSVGLRRFILRTSRYVMSILFHCVDIIDRCSSGTSGRCSSGLCQSGTCFERAIGSTVYAYCQCSPGYTGISCSQCRSSYSPRISTSIVLFFFSLGYFTCSAVGVFPDTANCAIGRYYYCRQATGGESSKSRL